MAMTMTTTRVDTLRMGVLLLTAHWFFGNLYEKVVLTPNILFGSIPDGIRLWNQLNWLTNPIYYFQPLNTVLLVLVWLVSQYSARMGRVHQLADRRVAIGVTVAWVLTVLIVTQVNLKLYFLQPSANRLTIEETYYLGFVLGLFRLLAEGYALAWSVRAIRMIHPQPNPVNA
ncbi:hypothetical protein [Spirosoma arcticum]